MPNSLTVFSFLACICLIVFGFNRGFDISDEGFYVLLTVPTQANEYGIINYDLFFKLLFKFTDYSFSLVELRLMRLIGYVLAAFALTKFLKSQFEISLSQAQVFFLSILGLFSGYAFLPPTLSYNSLTVVLGSFWLWLVSSISRRKSRTMAIGLILAVLVYVKFPVAIALLLLTLGIFIYDQLYAPSVYLLLFLPLVFLEICFETVTGSHALERLVMAVSIHSSREGYSFLELVKSPVLGVIFSLIPFLIAYFLIKLKLSKNHLVIFGMMGIGLVFWLGYFTHITEEWNHLVLLGTSALMGMMYAKTKRPLDRYAALLLIMPFVLHVGSNVYWLRIGIHYWVFWVLWIILHSKSLSRVGLAMYSGLIVFLVFNGIWWHPFGQEAPLWREKVVFENGKQTLWIDNDLAKITLQIRELSERMNLRELSAAYRIPGIVWLAGLQIPESSNSWDKIQLEQQSVIQPAALVFYPLESLPKSWVFTHQKELGKFQGNSVVILWN